MQTQTQMLRPLNRPSLKRRERPRYGRIRAQGGKAFRGVDVENRWVRWVFPLISLMHDSDITEARLAIYGPYYIDTVL